jgi:hypothetical protein
MQKRRATRKFPAPSIKLVFKPDIRPVYTTIYPIVQRYTLKNVL